MSNNSDMYDIDKIESIYNALMGADPMIDGEIRAIGDKHDVKIRFCVEKHHALQFTYYYSIDFGLGEFLHLQISDGIDNGTECTYEDWSKNPIYSPSPNFPTLSMVDVKLNTDAYKGEKTWKAEKVLAARKGEVMELYRRIGIDNYQTGDKSGFKDSGLLGQLKLTPVYEQVTANRCILLEGTV